MKKVLIFGTGGHAKVVAEAIESGGVLSLAGFVGTSPSESTFRDQPMIAENNILEIQDKMVVVAVGDNWKRHELVQKIQLRFPDVEFASVIHPAATVAKDVYIGQGTVIMAGTVINGGCVIGNHCIVNTAACIDHDSHLEDFASIAPGSVLGGNVTLKTFSAVSLGANVIHGITIGSHTIIGAGSVVVQSVPDNVVAYGHPCKAIKPRHPGDSYL